VKRLQSVQEERFFFALTAISRLAALFSSFSVSTITAASHKIQLMQDLKAADRVKRFTTNWILTKRQDDEWFVK